MSALFGPRDVLDALRADGVRTVHDAIRRSTCVRDLPRRSNHVLEAGGRRIFVKRAKGALVAREAERLRMAQAARVPTARLAFEGSDPALGAVTGTLDLAPARPFDDLLREGALSAPQIARGAEALGDAVGTLHEAGWTHRDLYLCHVFVGFQEGRLRLALIDLERLRRHRSALGPRVLKDLAALWSSLPAGSTTASQRARFLLRYLSRRGLPRRETFARLVARIRSKGARIRRHVPRTPVGEAARPPEEQA